MRRPSTRIYQNQLIIQLPRRHCNCFGALPLHRGTKIKVFIKQQKTTDSAGGFCFMLL
jgi:hypothetical protein